MLASQRASTDHSSLDLVVTPAVTFGVRASRYTASNKVSARLSWHVATWEGGTVWEGRR